MNRIFPFLNDIFLLGQISIITAIDSILSLRNSPHFIHSKNTTDSFQHFEFVFLNQFLSKIKTFGLDIGGNQFKIS